MDITPLLPKGQQIIHGYGDFGFRVNGQRFEGSVLVLPARTISWPLSSYAEVTPESLPGDGLEGVEIFLLGAGARGAAVTPALRQHFRDLGIGLDVMDTGAACRTFNVLLVEGRRVAAGLIAVA